MATVVQTWDGAKIVNASDPSVSSEYNIFDESDEFLAEAALNAATPLSFGGLVKKSVTIDARISATTWRGTVEWGKFEIPDPSLSEFSFDTSGGTAHVQTSILTRSGTAAPGMPAVPDFQNVIGVTDDGVEGVDITVPKYAFSEKHYWDIAYITTAYKATLFSLTGAFNNASFKGFAAGECMFMGASGSLRDFETWEIEYRFEAQPNRTSFAFGPITVPVKYGWDYVWGRFREVEDAPAGHLARRPIAAYVEQVSPAGNFALIGIGV